MAEPALPTARVSVGHVQSLAAVLQAIKAGSKQACLVKLDTNGMEVRWEDDSKALQSLVFMRPELFTHFQCPVTVKFSVQFNQLLDTLSAFSSGHGHGHAGMELMYPGPSGELSFEMQDDTSGVATCTYARIACVEMPAGVRDLEEYWEEPSSYFLTQGAVMKEVVDDLEWPGGNVEVWMQQQPARLRISSSGVGRLLAELPVTDLTGYHCAEPELRFTYKYKNLKAAFCNLPSPKEFGDVSTKVMIDRNGMLKVTHVIRMQQQGHGQAQGMVLDWAGAGAGGGSAFTQRGTMDAGRLATVHFLVLPLANLLTGALSRSGRLSVGEGGQQAEAGDARDELRASFAAKHTTLWRAGMPGVLRSGAAASKEKENASGIMRALSLVRKGKSNASASAVSEDSLEASESRPGTARPPSAGGSGRWGLSSFTRKHDDQDTNVQDVASASSQAGRHKGKEHGKQAEALDAAGRKPAPALGFAPAPGAQPMLHNRHSASAEGGAAAASILSSFRPASAIKRVLPGVGTGSMGSTAPSAADGVSTTASRPSSARPRAPSLGGQLPASLQQKYERGMSLGGERSSAPTFSGSVVAVEAPPANRPESASRGRARASEDSTVAAERASTSDVVEALTAPFRSPNKVSPEVLHVLPASNLWDSPAKSVGSRADSARGRGVDATNLPLADVDQGGRGGSAGSQQPSSHQSPPGTRVSSAGQAAGASSGWMSVAAAGGAAAGQSAGARTGSAGSGSNATVEAWAEHAPCLSAVALADGTSGSALDRDGGRGGTAADVANVVMTLAGAAVPSRTVPRVLKAAPVALQSPSGDDRVEAYERTRAGEAAMLCREGVSESLCSSAPLRQRLQLWQESGGLMLPGGLPLSPAGGAAVAAAATSAGDGTDSDSSGRSLYGVMLPGAQAVVPSKGSLSGRQA